MELTSNAIVDGGVIPAKYAELSCDGQNISPDLEWSGDPDGTQSYAVTCYDPDAPTGSGWWHWIGFDIPTSVTSIAEGGEFPGKEWDNDYGNAGYGGPCPPPGPAHRYIFTVYALDVAELGVGEGMTQAAVRFTLMSHVLDSASITGLFGTDESEEL